jgi:hypothetical protein
MTNLNLSDWNNRALFDAIMKELTARFECVPSQGIIAGQAVASACYRVTGLSESGPMNDLDVFFSREFSPALGQLSDELNPTGHYDISKGKYVRQRVAHKVGIRRVDGLSDMTVEENSFGHALGDSASLDGYTIVNSFRDPQCRDINYIEVGISSRRALSGTLILDGFDINACEIALDLSTDQVVWTDAFQNFLFRPWLSCTYWGTPMHTAIRLCRKISDIPFARICLDDEMRKLQSCLAVILHYGKCRLDRDGTHDRMPGNLLSPLYAGRFRDVQEMLSPYFTLHQHMCTFENTVINETSDTADFLSSESEFVADEVIERMMYRMHPTSHDEFATSSFIQAWFSRGTENTRGWYTAIRLEDISRLFKVWYALCHDHQGREGVEKLLRIPMLSESCTATPRAFLLMRHLKNNLRDVRQASEKDLARLYRMCAKHLLAFSRILQDPLPFRSELEIAKQFRWLEKNNMNYYIGWLENGVLDSDDRTILLSNGRSGSNDEFEYAGLLESNFRAKMKTIHQVFMSDLKSRFFSPQLPRLLKEIRLENPDVEVRELLSEYDFYWEGQSMRHCVGGHYSMAKRFLCSVLSINTEPNEDNLSTRSTLKLNFLCIEDRFEVSLGQHYSVGNTQPAPKNDLMAQSIIERACLIISTYNNDSPPAEGDDFFDCYHAQMERSRIAELP